jgi:Na+/H+ antiporter NhaC
MSEQPAFTPHFRASRSKRGLWFMLIGPLLWLIALVVLGVALRKMNVVELGLIIAGASFVLAIAVLVPMRRIRVREERDH